MRTLRPVVKVVPEVSPAVAVALADVKSHLRVSWSDEDGKIEAYIAAALALIDGPSGWLGRALISQDWQHVCGGPDFGRVWLTGEPTEIVSISYLDTDEASQTLTPSDFRIHTDGFGWAVTPKTGVSWPSFADRSDAMTIVYTTGFADAADVPAPIKQAVSLLVGHWFKEREAATAVSLKEMPFAVSALLENYKIGFTA